MRRLHGLSHIIFSKIEYILSIFDYTMPVDKMAHYILIAMSLGENNTYRALLAVGGVSVDLALDWLLVHRDDHGIDDYIDKEYN